MLWLNFLHFYQPANVPSFILKEALNKSYWRLLRLVEEHPDLRITINISGCLLVRLAEEKEIAFIERLRFLVKKGRIELTGSAAYHGLLPLLPLDEGRRQIKENEKILRKYFGNNFKPKGFFLPEMAYSPEVAKLIKKMGYSWIILDEISSATKPLHAGEIYRDSHSGLNVIFRDRELSNTYPPDVLLTIIKKINNLENKLPEKERAVLITATDAELYGLRHEDPTGEMEKVVKVSEFKTSTISTYINKQVRRSANLLLRPSTWESNLLEIKKGQPFKVWQDKKNPIQNDMWCLANLALSLGNKFSKDNNYYWYRWHLVRGLASCAFWWASARDFAQIYGPYAWSPDEIERGLEDLIRAVRSLEDHKTKKHKLLAEKYYMRIKKNIWSVHWKKHWHKNV